MIQILGRRGCMLVAAALVGTVLLAFLVPLGVSRAVVEVLRGLIVANLAVAALQAGICAASLAILAVPHAFSLGILCFFLAFVPVVGTAVVTVSAAVYLFSQGRSG